MMSRNGNPGLHRLNPQARQEQQDEEQHPAHRAGRGLVRSQGYDHETNREDLGNRQHRADRMK